jgi:TonB family protein
MRAKDGISGARAFFQPNRNRRADDRVEVRWPDASAGKEEGTMRSSRYSSIYITANQRFKAQSRDWMRLGFVAAVAAHFALFSWFPTLQAADIGFAGDDTLVIELPPEVVIPPPPDEIMRPATPRLSTEPVAEEATIPPTGFDSNPVEGLAPPPTGARPSEVPAWIDRDTEPRLRNKAALIELAERRYPAMLREAGVSGSVGVYFFVSERGQVTNAVVQSSSGYAQLDGVALEVAKTGEFEPAMNRDRPVGVWIVLPINFEAD